MPNPKIYGAWYVHRPACWRKFSGAGRGLFLIYPRLFVRGTALKCVLKHILKVHLIQSQKTPNLLEFQAEIAAVILSL